MISAERINLYNYCGNTCVTGASPHHMRRALEGQPHRKEAGLFFCCAASRSEGRPIASPLKHLAITAGCFIYIYVCHHMRLAPPRLATADPFSGPRRSPDMCAASTGGRGPCFLFSPCHRTGLSSTELEFSADKWNP